MMKKWPPAISRLVSNPQPSGQVGLIVLLVMVVILALGLSLATRTSQQAEFSIQQEDTTRVFNAAEAGVEAALSSIFQGENAGDLDGISEDQTALNLTGSDANINYNITKSETLEMQLRQGTSTEIAVSPSSNVVFQWATESSCDDTASLLISIYSDNAGTVTARHYPVGDCSGASTREDNFIANNSGTAPYQYSYTVTTGANDQFIRVKPVYNDTDIRVTGSNATSQFIINSQAQNTLAGQETRTFEVRRTLSTAPAFMEYALVSGSSIIKN